MLVKDVGEVAIGQAPRLGQFGFNDHDEAVEGVILMRTGEQAQVVLERIEIENPRAEPVRSFRRTSRSVRSTTVAT